MGELQQGPHRADGCGKLLSGRGARLKIDRVAEKNL